MQLMFSTDDVHPRDRLVYWQDVGVAIWSPLEHQVTGPRDFQARIQGGSLGPLNLMLVESSPCEIIRGAAASSSADDVLILLQLDGTWIGTLGDHKTRLEPGELVLVDPQRPFSVEVGPGFRQLMIEVPRVLLEVRLGAIAPFAMQKVSEERSIGGLTFDFLKALPACGTSLSDVAAQHIASQALDLLTVAYTQAEKASPVTRTAARMAALFRLKGEIESRLFDSSLSTEEYAEKAGMSARYANKLLETEDTSLERYIFARRLEKSRAALDSLDYDDLSISEIAHTHGFASASHFTRRFKEAFEVAPAEYRERRAKG
ncbi:MAG: helix-turn-helix domain-containing protein [Methyloceanibacter sp.]|nr:helix-turn-helix domain-containing protein [Methyloceanibacter sp.]